MSYTVYKHTSPSGKVYIGITKKNPPRKRWDNGRGYKHSPHFNAAIQKYGWENFQHEILAEGLTKEEAEKEEIRLISALNATDRRFGYNADSGGTAGPGRISEETREKLRAHMLGDLNPTRRYGHPFKGKHHTPESKARMSAAAKVRPGRVCTQETRQKLQKAQAKKPVINLSTGEKFPSIHEAARACHVEPAHICRVCKGRRKSHKGQRWEYI